jgi:hypothetical protein
MHLFKTTQLSNIEQTIYSLVKDGIFSNDFQMQLQKKPTAAKRPTQKTYNHTTDSLHKGS